jgi:L-ascorbate metabolism protein UlaG (beta-lactamase superfamily)
MATIRLTWLGHAAFRFDTPSGKRVYVDPFLDGNPKCPENEKEPERVDLIAVTHAHNDHVGSTLELAQKFGCPVVVPMAEFGDWLEFVKGLSNVTGFSKGGTVEVEGVTITATDARHSSGFTLDDGSAVYLGEPAGLVISDGDSTKLYFAGDTCVFGDMKIIADLYAPDVAILPIGNFYTMDPREAALALELLRVKRCIPCHYGTFPVLTGRPEELRELASGVEILEMQPGETIEL